MGFYIDREELELLVSETLRKYLEGEMIPAPPQAGVPTAEILGAGVRAELARRNIHPRELAQLLGVTTATVRLRMSGAYPFKPDEMTKVLELLHLSLAELYALSRHGA